MMKFRSGAYLGVPGANFIFFLAMEDEKINHSLVAGAKALKTYLQGIEGDELERPGSVLNNVHVGEGIRRKYSTLLEKLPDDESFDNLLTSSQVLDGDNLKAVIHEVTYICDVLDQLVKNEQEVRVESRTHAPVEEQGTFTQEELKKIDDALSALKNNMIKILESSSQSKAFLEGAERFIEGEIRQLKDDARKIGKKDWKNHLLNLAMSLIILFSFSAEARTTVIETFSVITFSCFDHKVDLDAVPPQNSLLLASEYEETDVD